MNVIPELREALVSAPSRRARLSAIGFWFPRRAVASLAIAGGLAAAVLAIAVLTTTADREMPATPAKPVAPPAGPTLRCASGYTIDRRHVTGDWRSHAITIGAVTFLGLADQADRPAWRFAKASEYARHIQDDPMVDQLLANGEDRYAGVGLNVLVAPDRRTTLSVDPRDRTHVGLMTALPTFGGFLPEDGESSVTFEGCPPLPADLRPSRDVTETAFGLAIVVAGARCIPLTVTTEDEPPESKVVSFGSGRCPE